MPNETTCPTCGGEISSKTCDGCKGICVRYIRKPGWPSDKAVCWDCEGEGIQDIKSTAAERAEREAWERHCPKCKHKTPTGHCIKLEERHTVSDVSFDTCPLRPCNKGKGEA